MAILVLGMHRSGTSCLAGSLQQRGLHLGQVYESRPYNQKGNRENQQVMDLNDAVLAYSGGSWDRPPARLAWSAAHAHERDALVAGLRGDGRRPWGFKDPRTLLTLAFWREALSDARLVGTFRHPLAVARSLAARDRSMSLDRGMELWREYNQRLLDCHDRAPFPLLDFDADEDDYRRGIEAISAGLGLGLAPADEFFERGLRNQAADATTALPGPVEAVHRRLLGLALA